MKKSLNFLTVIALLSATMFIFSCKEIPGPQGAAGTPGLNGRDGVAGISCAPGTPGKDGNANVKSSVFTVNASDWIKRFYSGSSTQYYFSSVMVVPEITKAVLDKGLVIIYRSNGSSSSSWIALPYTSSYQTTSKTYVTTYTPVHTEGGVAVWLEDSDGLPIPPSSAISFKVVVITPAGLAAHPNTNFKNYKEVADTFELE